jgi:hypothetical protein
MNVAPKHQRVLLVLTVFSILVALARADDRVLVSARIDGKQLQLAPEVSQELAADSISLLASCRYWSLHDGNANQPYFQAADKRSCLVIAFATTKTVAVPTEKAKVEVKQLMITLPLSSGRIWVLSARGASYLAKFSPDIARQTQDVLNEAQKL